MPKKQAVNLALAKKATLNFIFKGPLKALRSEFKNPDIQWAKSLAGGNRKMMEMVMEESNNAILSRVNKNRTQEIEVLKATRQYSQRGGSQKRNGNGFWTYVETLAMVELHILDKDFIKPHVRHSSLNRRKKSKKRSNGFLWPLDVQKRMKPNTCFQ